MIRLGLSLMASSMFLCACAQTYGPNSNATVQTTVSPTVTLPDNSASTKPKTPDNSTKAK